MKYSEIIARLLSNQISWLKAIETGNKCIGQRYTLPVGIVFIAEAINMATVFNFRLLIMVAGLA
jgi:hypothetical protein